MVQGSRELTWIGAIFIKNINKNSIELGLKRTVSGRMANHVFINNEHAKGVKQWFSI